MSFGDTSDDTSSDQDSKSRKRSSNTIEPKQLDLKALPKIAEKKRKVEEKKHKCPEIGCGAVFTRPYRLKNHITTHHSAEEKPFKCSFEDCERTYSSQSHLKRHENAVHIGDDDENSSEVLCDEPGCGLIFSNKQNLKRHITRVHIDLPFECPVCSEKFRRKGQLNAHKVEVHNEEAPYKCNDCPASFVHLHQYRKHQSRHKTYKCDCEKIFCRWTEYLKHKRTSCSLPITQYTCAVCNKTFALKQNLTQHCLHVHLPDSRIEVFKCPYLDCNRSYNYKKNLRFHIKHFHEKIFDYFKCTSQGCEKVLKSKKNLKQHLRLCHSDRPLKEKLRRKPRKDKGISKPRKNPKDRKTKKPRNVVESFVEMLHPNGNLAKDSQSAKNVECNEEGDGKEKTKVVESVAVLTVPRECDSEFLVIGRNENDFPIEANIVFDFPEFNQFASA